MTYIKAFIMAALISFVSVPVFAATVDDGPPVHDQKNQVPQTTDSGNYLETQPVENNNSTGAEDAQHNKTKNKIKGGNVTDKPKDGGVEVKPRK